MKTPGCLPPPCTGRAPASADDTFLTAPEPWDCFDLDDSGGGGGDPSGPIPEGGLVAFEGEPIIAYGEEILVAY